MQRRIELSLLTALACFCLFGCSVKQNLSKSAEEDHKSFELADHSEQFTAWVSGDNHANKRTWIWCDVERDPVSYRVTGGGQSGEWKPMKKIVVSEDESQTIKEDPTGKHGAAETLPSGKYTVVFKVGNEQFSGVTLQVD